MMHESGTGGAPEYGVVAQLPFTEDFSHQNQVTLTRTQQDTAKVGYYAANTSNVDIEITAGERFGILKYNFHNTSQYTSKVLVNASHHLTAPDRSWWTQYFVNGSLMLLLKAIPEYQLSRRLGRSIAMEYLLLL